MPGAVATTVVGTQLIGGVFGMVQGEQQQKILQQQAAQERAASQIEAEDFKRRVSLAQAASRAQQGRSGVMQNTGSPLAVSEDFAGQVALQAQRILQGGTIRSAKMEQQGQFAKNSGIGSFFGSVGRAGATLVNPAVQRRFGFNPRPGLQDGLDLTPQFPRG